MREIKCKAFVENDIIEGRKAQMYTVLAYYWKPSGNEVELWDGLNPVATLAVKWCNILWSTGRKDKNGKEIYEGDIVNVYSPDYSRDKDNALVRGLAFMKKGDVKFRDGGFYVDCDGYSPRFSTHFHEWKVIGNIYENKELLKGETDERQDSKSKS